MSAWYQPGSATLTGGSRLTPTTIMTNVNLTDNTSNSSSRIDVSNYLTKSFRINLATTGIITDYRVQITILSCDTDTPANYAEIVYEIYEADGTYHWSIEDAGKWIMIKVKQWGTAAAGNYVTVNIAIEATAA